MKKILSFFLVLCMLITSIPMLVLPVFAEGDDEVNVLQEYNFIDEFGPGVTYTISEIYKNQPLAEGVGPFGTDEEYLEWLLSDGVFAVNQGESNWKIGEFDVATGAIDPFTRLAFGAGDNAQGRHDMNWVVTESVYERLTRSYVETGSPSGGSIWNGNGIWHLHAGSHYLGANGIDNVTPTDLAFGRMTTSGTGFYTAIQYTVADAGTYGVKMNAFSEYSAGGHAVAIFKNNELVWPIGAAKKNQNSWFQTSRMTNTDTLNTLLTSFNVKVEAGDKISFVVGKAGDALVWAPVLMRLEGAPIYVSIADPDGINTNSYKVKPNTEFTIPTYEGDKIFFGWDADGDGSADYADGATITVGEDSITLNALILKPSKFYDQRPYWDANNEQVVHQGDWVFGAWDKTTGEFLPVQYYSNPFVSISGSGPWGAGAPSMYSPAREGLFAMTGTLDYEGGYVGEKAEGNYVASLQYTATYNGTAQVDFDQLSIGRELNDKEDATPSAIVAGFAIYVDNVKVWPADGKEYYWFDSSKVMADAENGGIYEERNISCDFRTAMMEDGSWPFPVTLEDVAIGSVIDIRAVRGTPYNWAFYIRPTVSFSELAETPVVSSTSVDIEEDFTLNIFTSILGKEEGSTPAMEYWTSKPSAIALQNGGKQLELVGEVNGMYKFAYEGLAAKNMADVIYVRPYTVNETTGGQYGEVTEVSIQKYAEAALGKNEKLDELLVAMLNYGADAQSLFFHNTNNLANANIKTLAPELADVKADLGAIVDSYAHAEGEVRINDAALLMGTDIGMKYVMNLVEGATTYELEYSKNADFSESTTIAMVETKGNGGVQMKGIYNIKFAELQDVFYVRPVVDGEAGATLTYSVESYVLRISDVTSNNGLYHAAMSLACFGQKLAAYMA